MHNEMCTCKQCRQSGEAAFEILEFGAVSPLSEAQEMELAMELLNVASEEELDQFFGKLVKGIGKGFKKFGKAVGKVVKPLGGALKSIAKTALPMVGGALGSFIPIPGVGTALGSALGGAVAKALEMEFEGMQPEQQEFEIARRVVRIASTATQQLATAGPGQNPDAAVRRALSEAVRSHALAAAEPMPRPVVGRWRQRRALSGAF